MGRHIFAFGGNLEASRFAGLPLNRIQIGVFALSGLTAGFAAFLGASFYGSTSSGDAQGYELYVIASAVVGGASLIGGRGSALGATFGALLIVLIRQSIRTLHFDQNYEWIVIGCAIIIAVVVDQWSTRLTARRLSQAADRAHASRPELSHSGDPNDQARWMDARAHSRQSLSDSPRAEARRQRALTALRRRPARPRRTRPARTRSRSR